jgi:hypothetical protein
LPASRTLAALTLFIILSSAVFTFPDHHASTTSRPIVGFAPFSLSSAINSALLWLAHNQSADGSYGAFQEHLAAAAAYALWYNDSNSPKAALSYSWLAHQLNNSQTWFWGQYGEADVPGAILFSLALSSNLRLVNATIVAGNLLQLQKANSGFEGYFDGSATVASSVDTDMALLGLINARAISVSSQTHAIDYVLSLQNPNGSFNLTSGKPFDPFYSLGPDSISITALTVLVLRSAGFAHDSPSVSSALSFLNAAASSGFGGHLYAEALSALALKAFNEPANVATAVGDILSHQNSDGGFGDSSRSSTKSNALDTGLAAVALEENPILFVNYPPTAAFAYGPVSPSVGVMVHFNGSSSHDSDGDQLSYLWTFGDGSSAIGVTPFLSQGISRSLLP